MELEGIQFYNNVVKRVGELRQYALHVEREFPEMHIRQPLGFTDQGYPVFRLIKAPEIRDAISGVDWNRADSAFPEISIKDEEVLAAYVFIQKPQGLFLNDFENYPAVVQCGEEIHCSNNVLHSKLLADGEHAPAVFRYISSRIDGEDSHATVREGSNNHTDLRITKKSDMIQYTLQSTGSHGQQVLDVRAGEIVGYYRNDGFGSERAEEYIIGPDRQVRTTVSLRSMEYDATIDQVIPHESTQYWQNNRQLPKWEFDQKISAMQFSYEEIVGAFKNVDHRQISSEEFDSHITVVIGKSFDQAGLDPDQYMEQIAHAFSKEIDPIRERISGYAEKRISEMILATQL
jgi:hypothetical protein